MDKIATAAPAVPEPVEHVVKIGVDGCEGNGSGSGFLVAGDMVVTNRHVVENARRLSVERGDGTSLGTGHARVARRVDLAVVSLDRPAGGGPAVAGNDPVPGDRVTVVGYPGGGEATATRGRVVEYADGSDFGEPGRVMRVSADVEPGSSGGPVIDEDGDVVGVVFAIEMDSGLTLALPPSALRSFLGAEPGRADDAERCG